MAQVTLDNLYKSYAATGETGRAAVLKRINLTVKDGEFLVLVGPSGCGKSTLLRSIAGLEEVTGGKIWVGDKLVNDLPPKQRDIGMVFQSYALYPHMSVYDNIAFGLRRSRTATDTRTNWKSLAKMWLVELTRNWPRGLRYTNELERDIAKQVDLVAKMLQIENLLDRLPKQLSGGQKQRVALGRAIARNASVFLMDEPLSNLDAKLRAETRSQIVKLQRQLGTTTIYVTHDRTEAMTMGDRIAVMYEGQIQQLDRPLNIYHHPANIFVAQFIGSPAMNLIEVKIKPPCLISSGEFRLTLPPDWEKPLQPYHSQSLLLGIRPEDLHLSSPAPKNLHGIVEAVEVLGNESYLAVSLQDLATENIPCQVRIPPDKTVSIGEEVWLAIVPEKIHFFDPSTTLAIDKTRS